MKTKLSDLELLNLLTKGCFNVEFNLNDTFHWACSDSTAIPSEDLQELIPIIKSHGYIAIISYEALKRGYDPDEEMEVCGEEFDSAKKDIQDLLNEGKLKNIQLIIKTRKDEMDLFGEEISYKNDSSGLFYSKEGYKLSATLAFLPNQGIGVVGLTQHKAKENLIKTYTLLKAKENN